MHKTALILIMTLGAATLPLSAAARPGYVAGSYALADDADFEPPSGQTVAVKETRFAAVAPVAGSADRGFDIGIDYQYTRYTYDEVDSRNRDLHRLQLTTGYTRAFEGWSVDAFVAPGVATSSNVLKDLAERISSDDVLLTARAEIAWERSETTRVIAGLAWDRSFGEPRAYPVVGIEYAPSPDLTARIAFPDPAVRFAPSERQAWTLRLYPAGFEWHVLDDDLVTELDYRVEAWRAETWWSVRALRSLFVDASLAWEFKRRHEFADRTGARFERDVGNVVFVTIGLRWGHGPPLPTHMVARTMPW